MAKKINESRTDIAYRLLKSKNQEIAFYDLWDSVKEEVIKAAELNEEEKVALQEDISFFYTCLTTDGRFVMVGDNKWDLRERLPFEKIHIDINDIYVEDEIDESEDENNDNNDYSNPDDFNESYDDSTGSDAEINRYQEAASQEDEDL